LGQPVDVGRHKLLELLKVVPIWIVIINVIFDNNNLKIIRLRQNSH
jgi:hypothetical protein